MIPSSLPSVAARRTRLLILPILLALPAVAGAQTFSGTGAGMTPVFVLTEGLTRVSIQSTHDAFTAYLIASNGSVVEELSATPRQDVRVPEDGRYVFDVRTAGVWNISIEGPDSLRVLAVRGRIAGAQAAGGSPPAGWLLKGLGAGLVTGPLGAVFVAQRAWGADVTPDPALEARLAGEPPTYAEAFREAYVDQRRSNQRTAAVVGGVTGTAVLAFVILQLTVWDDGGGSGGGEPPPTETAARIPLVRIPLP